VRFRLLQTKLMILGLLPLLVFSHHVYREDSMFDTLLGSLGLALLVAAAMGRIWASLYLAGRKDRELVVQGPYSIMRHPLYFFSFLGFLGAGLAFESLVLTLVLATVFAVGHWPAMQREEARLAELFGDEYERYRRGVPRFLPRPRRMVMPHAIHVHTGSFTLALREAALIPLILVVADLLEWAKLAGILPVLVLIH
jgi:protein-S-isoprenylcysteine O-methyltransferase Ste14